MKKSIFLMLCLVIGLASCKKDEEDVFIVADFENATSANLASSIYGENLYGGAYAGYTDVVTDLSVKLLQEYFYNGGIALSQWNDTATAGYANQCSVFYKDAATGFGGNKGSKTFAVSYGCDNSSYPYGADTRPVIEFSTEGVEKIFDHFYVNNSTYAYLSMKNGDSYCRKMSYTDKDWFKLTIYGIKKDGTVSGQIDFYLADFRTSTSKGIVDEWTKIDLTSLGAIHGLKFDMTSSIVGDYGSNVPSYFCFDDVTIKK